MLSDCPRCESLLRFGSDMYGKFYSCIQCGYYKDNFCKLLHPSGNYLKEGNCMHKFKNQFRVYEDGGGGAKISKSGK